VAQAGRVVEPRRRGVVIGSVYLRDMATWFRQAGLKVIEQEGWQNRSRSTGGYEPGRPWCIMWHHTAGAAGASAQGEVNYMCYVSDAKPTANIYIERGNGNVWVMAAGASNTNGTGRSRTFSKGTVPSDSMNVYAVGIEIGNNGVGEPYSQAVIDNTFKVNNILCNKLGLRVTDLDTHQDYAPDRKVDPSTSAAVQGPWKPGVCTSAGSWKVDDVRAEAARRGAPEPTPEPEEEDEVPTLLIQANNGTADQKAPTFWWDGKNIGWTRSGAANNLGVLTGVYKRGGNAPFKNMGAAEIQRLINSGWIGGPVPKGYTLHDPHVDTGVG
jgi:N-acetylmuramoyl-L-alanine amidase